MTFDLNNLPLNKWYKVWRSYNKIDNMLETEINDDKNNLVYYERCKVTVKQAEEEFNKSFATPNLTKGLETQQ